MKGSRDHVAIYLEAADSASAPTGWKRYVDFKLGVASQTARRRPRAGAVSPGSELIAPRGAQAATGAPDKSVWRTGAHEFNSETSDGTWGFSQARTPERAKAGPNNPWALPPPRLCAPAASHVPRRAPRTQHACHRAATRSHSRSHSLC